MPPHTQPKLEPMELFPNNPYQWPADILIIIFSITTKSGKTYEQEKFL